MKSASQRLDSSRKPPAQQIASKWYNALDQVHKLGSREPSLGCYRANLKFLPYLV